MIYDTFMFAGEADMLLFRLEHLSGKVDRHVIAEARVTHRGVPREPWVPEHLHCCLRPWEDKIGYVQVARFPASITTDWGREHHQRDCLWDGLVAFGDLAPHDVVLIADLDEIPSDAALAADLSEMPRAATLSMRTFHSAVDWEYPEPQLTSVITLTGNISWPDGTLSKIRDDRNGLPVIQDAGWHFSWLGTTGDRARKLDERSCHAEDMGEWEALAIRTGATWEKGEHANRDARVKPVTVDGTWPPYIQQRKCPPSWFRPGEAS